MFDSLGRTIRTDKKIYDAVPAEKQEPVFFNYINHFQWQRWKFASVSNIFSQTYFEEFWCSEHRNYGLKASKAN